MGSKTTSYNPEAQYRVEPADRITLYGQVFYPGHTVTIRGDVLTSLDPALIKTAVLAPEIANTTQGA